MQSTIMKDKDHWLNFPTGIFSTNSDGREIPHSPILFIPPKKCIRSSNISFLINFNHAQNRYS
jgi:hypothetical protein